MASDNSSQDRESASSPNARSARAASSKVGWWVAGALMVAAAGGGVVLWKIRQSPATAEFATPVDREAALDGNVEKRIDAIAKRFADQVDSRVRMNVGLDLIIRTAVARAVRGVRATGMSEVESVSTVDGWEASELLAFLDGDIAQKKSEGVEIHRERAVVCYMLRQFELAEQSLHAILRSHPDDLDAMTQLGHIRRVGGNLDEAGRLFQRVGELAPDDSWRAVSLGFLGMVQNKRGDQEAAERSLKQALTIDEKLGRDQLIAVWCAYLGAIEHNNGNWDSAESFYRRAIDIDERLGHGLYVAAHLCNLGSLADEQKDYPEARRYWTLSRDRYRSLGAKKFEMQVQALLDELPQK